MDQQQTMDDPNFIINDLNVGLVDHQHFNVLNPQDFNEPGGTTFTQVVTDSELSLHGQSHNMNNV